MAYRFFVIPIRDEGPAGGKNGAGRGKIDYRDVLSTDDLADFARLRQACKEVALTEAVPQT
jgi:hypothetical protein